MLLSNFLVLFTFIPASYAMRYRCPTHEQMQPCDCQSGVAGLEVFCENSSLDEVRKVLTTVGHTRQPIEQMKLKGIWLPTLPSNLLVGKDVESIDVQNCSTFTVDREAFAGVAANLKSLLLAGNDLESVPSEALENLTRLEKLNLDYNRIGVLHAKAFKGLHSITELSLQGNRIQFIDDSAFVGMGIRLKKLDLDWNELTAVPRLALRNQSSLNHLDLSSNKIASILIEDFDAMVGGLFLILELSNNLIGQLPAGVFGTFKNLHLLDVSGNVIESIHPLAFQGTEDTLEFLMLGNNRLEEVPSAALRNMGRLEFLALSGNHICEVRKDDFLPYGKSLVLINLGNNSLSYVDKEAFLYLGRLTHLGLGSNNLNALPYETFEPVLDTLIMLDIHGNPLHCDCNLTWLRDLMSGNGTDAVLSTNGTKCSTPEEHANKLIAKIPSNQLLCGNSTPNLPLPCCNCPTNTHHQSSSSYVIASLLQISQVYLAATALVTSLMSDWSLWCLRN